jgi:glycine betaine/proline transport system ATP-binding protein
MWAAARREASPTVEEIVTTVKAENLYKIYGRRPEQVLERLRAGADPAELRGPHCTPAVVDASFEVAPGQIFVVVGLSGSGKSTLIRMVNGLVEPAGGRVLIDGEDLTALPPGRLRALRARKISMVFQHFALFPHRTVLDNAAYGLEVQKVDKQERRERAAETLRLVGLAGWEDRHPHQLSGGMQQRVGLARALATDASVLLMDEAFSALDPLIRREMQDELLELQSSLNRTIIFITHDLNEAMRLGDQIAVMRAGRIVQTGTAEEILNDPANNYVAAFVQDVDRARVLTAASVMVEPRARIGPGEGPRAALRVMSEKQVSALFVVGNDRRLVGAVGDAAVARAVRQGHTRVDQFLDVEPVVVAEDTPLAEILTPAAESTLPIAVVDEQRRLIGVVPRVTLLAALGGGDSGQNGLGADAAEPDAVAVGEEVSSAHA